MEIGFWLPHRLITYGSNTLRGFFFQWTTSCISKSQITDLAGAPHANEPWLAHLGCAPLIHPAPHHLLPIRSAAQIRNSREQSSITALSSPRILTTHHPWEQNLYIPIASHISRAVSHASELGIILLCAMCLWRMQQHKRPSKSKFQARKMTRLCRQALSRALNSAKGYINRPS